MDEIIDGMMAERIREGIKEETRKIWGMVSKELLDILVCPKCKSDVRLSGDVLICLGCEAEYEVVDGVPIMLVKDE